MNIKLRLLAAAVFTAGMLAATSASAALIVESFTGNDCSGEFGKGDNCAFNGSPFIAKFNTGTKGGWETNTTLFPSINGTEWSFSPNNPPDGTEVTGSWDYTPGIDDPDIRYWVAKGGNGFNLFFEVPDPLEVTCLVDPASCYDDALSVTSGAYTVPSDKSLSHISFYDTGAPPPPGVPEPSFIALFGIGLLGMGLFHIRRKRKAA